MASLNDGGRTERRIVVKRMTTQKYLRSSVGAEALGNLLPADADSGLASINGIDPRVIGYLKSMSRWKPKTSASIFSS